MSRRRRTLVLLVDVIHLAYGNPRHFLDLPPLHRRRFHGEVQQRRGPRWLAPHAPVQHLLLVLRLDGVLLAVPVRALGLVEGDSPVQSHDAPLLAQEGVQQAQVGDAAAEAVVGDEDGLEAGKSGEGVPVQLQDAVVAEVQSPQLLHLGEHVLVADLPQVVAPQVQLLQRGEERRQHPQVQRLQLVVVEVESVQPTKPFEGVFVQVVHQVVLKVQLFQVVQTLERFRLQLVYSVVAQVHSVGLRVSVFVEGLCFYFRQKVAFEVERFEAGVVRKTGRFCDVFLVTSYL